MRRVAAGRVVNAGDFATSVSVSRDWMLRFLFRKKNWGRAGGGRGVDARGPSRRGERGRGGGVRRARRDTGQDGRHPAGRGAGRVKRGDARARRYVVPCINTAVGRTCTSVSSRLDVVGNKQVEFFSFFHKKKTRVSMVRVSASTPLIRVRRAEEMPAPGAVGAARAAGRRPRLHAARVGTAEDVRACASRVAGASRLAR